MKFRLLVFAFVLSSVALGAQNQSRPDLSVFPNPATEFISVEDHSDLVGEISVISMAGRKVKLFTYTKGEQYAVSDLPKGMYLVQLIDKSKRILTTQKLEKR
ncbi:MAG: T9SS type A sorting domain-containing protein [Saprospiraceae bacterium]|nr:T9SS type A sorting domain-containing protein [Saprospiraceae bacterium]